MKKIFIISTGLLVVVLIFLGIYNFVFKESKSPIVQSTARQDDLKEPSKTGEQSTLKIPEKILAISNQPIIGPIFDKKTETILYHSAKDGTVWTINADGSGEKKINSRTIEGLKSILWTQDHIRALITTEKNGQKNFYEYDYNTNKESLLKSGLDAVVWDILGAGIIYKYYDPISQERTLNIANPDGSNWKKIADVSFREISISPVPSTSTVSFWNSPNAEEETKLIIVGAIGGEQKTILQGRFGADYLWSPDGTQALVSSLATKDGKMTTLGTVTIDGQYHDLGIPTFVSKCVWSRDGKVFYYALPGAIPENAKIPNDYRGEKFTTEDTFWKMDITTGKKERIINTDEIKGKYDSSNLFLSATEGALYFINRSDKKLYKIEI